jgi:hypothetical protein
VPFDDKGVEDVVSAISQCKMAPSDPPETNIGCSGCHATAIHLLEYIEKKIIETLTAHFFLMALQNAELFHCANIEYANCLIP